MILQSRSSGTWTYSQVIELYTFKMFSFLHVNHTSIKWFLKKRKKKFKHRFAQRGLYQSLLRPILRYQQSCIPFWRLWSDICFQSHRSCSWNSDPCGGHELRFPFPCWLLAKGPSQFLEALKFLGRQPHSSYFKATTMGYILSCSGSL